MDGGEVHVQIVTYAMQGHINPMLRLAKGLVAKGLHVVLATTENGRQRLLNFKTSITQETMPAKSPTFNLEFFSDGLSNEFDRNKYLDSFFESPQTVGSKNLSNLIIDLKAKCNKISCIITNPFMPWVSGIAAEHDIPSIVLWIQACEVYSIYCHYFKHPYLFPSLENQDDVVELPDMPIIATALRKSDRPFVWVIKPPEKGSSKKSGELPSGFLEETKERGLVVKWCPQEKVLMHQAMACFMTHCGWISTLETIVAEMPVIAYPEMTYQSIDAKLLVDVLKIGVRMRNGEDEALGAKEVERCIMEMTDEMTATHMKKRATALKEAAKKAVEDGGSSDQNINNFINEIKGKSL
ncbi:hypothetical protein Patl1_28605 [Pistacia atlantica]|uniref:Uncharacterized protein n=1 Tax=Pistacia atlantica TaxID=434234 RepID=A0ACC1BFF7_9ROSI|nr:hypothetical protein Patl1_28605 [Pistacia atlantica]